MAVNFLTLKQSMSKNIQAIMPQDEDKEFFQRSLTTYLTKLIEHYYETEEHQKNLLISFLKEAVFPNNEVNTKERADLVVLNGSSLDSPIAILIENKSTTNNSEMPKNDHMNTKAFQELVSYYLRERIVHKNIEIKKCIITNGLSWYIIDANEFEQHFYKNKRLTEHYQKFVDGQLSGNKTDFLYKEVISPEIEKAISNGIKIVHFNLRDALKKGSDIELKKANITQLYRFFSLENLLKKEIFTDPNKLNKNFYDELLYLMGLEEKKQDNKKVIQRVETSKRQNGTLLENTMNRLSLKSDLEESDRFDVAMQLCVVWVNRILFLKLLESQLITFNNNNGEFVFLTKEKLPSFEDIYELFFGVLAKRPTERMRELKIKYDKLPYLNSSLFEETLLERKYLGIDSLKEQTLYVFSKTKLKDINKKKKKGKLDFITYLFEFLNSYDFSTSVYHQKDVKNDLINASVLGLIFEKINGYKDGSFYTPGKITMFMSRKAVRKAVIDKFNNTNNWNARILDDIQYKIQTLDEAKLANEIIDSIKICDPAVGSGHFLVSVLNELLAIKSELGILLDDNGKSLNGYSCNVINDDLVFQDMNGDNFIYKINNAEKNRVQRAIFNEKRKLIENCLFGVDINQNSVNICRLRLWIELLKSSYYHVDQDNKQNELVTLPNIDINIKVGNSLLHKLPFDLDLNKGKGLDYSKYFNAVAEYKRVNDKSKKAEITKQIEGLKLTMRASFLTPEQKEILKYRAQLSKLNQLTLFEESKEQKKLRKKKIANAEKKLKAAKAKEEENERNPLWKNAMEWRMEFPEILDVNGNFLGFDLILANPPYIYSANEFFSKEEKRYFSKTYPMSNYQANTFGLFLELSLKLLNKNGHISFIIPNSFLTVGQYDELRKYLINNTSDLFILNSKDKIFEDANIDNCILNFSVSTPTTVKVAELNNGEIYELATVEPSYFENSSVISISGAMNDEATELKEIISKMDKESKSIFPEYGDVKDGIKAYERGKGNPPQTTDEEEFKLFKESDPFAANEQIDESYRKFLVGKNVERYSISWNDTWIKYGKNLAASRKPEMFEGERILIRQIPKSLPYSLTAAFTDEDYVHERSAICIRKLTVSPFFLVGVLNSIIESFWAVIKFDMLQRKTFPQLRLYQIKELPIPNATKEQQDEIEFLVKEMLQLISKEEIDDAAIDSLTEKIDDKVMDLFRLAPSEKEFVKDLCAKNK